MAGCAPAPVLAIALFMCWLRAETIDPALDEAQRKVFGGMALTGWLRRSLREQARDLERKITDIEARRDLN